MQTGTIADIEGMAAAAEKRLRAAGINTWAELIEAGRTAERREELAAVTGYTPKQLLEWVNLADTLRIKVMAKARAELLRKSGITTLQSTR